MRWTTNQPKVSGNYWLKSRERDYDGTFTGGYHMPQVVRVKISEDPEWPDAFYSTHNYEQNFSFKEGDLWAGPIPPPKD